MAGCNLRLSFVGWGIRALTVAAPCLAVGGGRRAAGWRACGRLGSCSAGQLGGQWGPGCWASGGQRPRTRSNGVGRRVVGLALGKQSGGPARCDEHGVDHTAIHHLLFFLFSQTTTNEDQGIGVVVSVRI